MKGTLHWVSARHAVGAEVRLYEPLFPREEPLDVPEGESYLDHVDAGSLRVAPAFVEPSVRGAAAGTRLQFERLGYFCVDPDTTDVRPVLNRTVTLRDSWAKQATRS